MPLLLVIAEIVFIYYFIQFFGFFELILFYVVTTFVGILILRSVGSNTLRQFQTGQVVQGNSSLISKGLLFLSGVLMLVPSMVSKFFGILLVIPPVRWIVAIGFAGFLMKKVFSANSFVHQFGTHGFRFYYSGGGSPFQQPNSNRNPDFQNDENVIEADFKKIDDTKQLR